MTNEPSTTSARPARRVPRSIRITAYVAILGGALLVTYLSTRDAPAPIAAEQHVHGSSGTSTGAPAQSVTLDQGQARRIGVTYTTATAGPLRRDVRTVGQVTFDETRVRAVTLKVDGWVERLHVNATGQPVSIGQPLFSIYSPMLVQAQEELLLARSLQGDVSAASKDVRDHATSLIESARRRLLSWDVASGDIDEIERLGQVRRTITFHSSASGAVLEKNVVEGQRVMAGEVLYRIADLRDVWVEGEIFEQDLSTIRVGQVVHAEFPALPGEHRMGRIAFVYPTVIPETRTTRVRVVLPNRGGRLKPGMYASLRIVGAERTGVLTVPRDAVLSTGERHVVFVRESDGRLAPHEVEVGVSTDDRIEILRGLHAGATVVATATFLVDAESNLTKALGGMGDMPGMEMQTPPKRLPMREPPR